MAVLSDIKNRGVADVIFVWADGLKGLPDAIEATWPTAITQTRGRSPSSGTERPNRATDCHDKPPSPVAASIDPDPVS